MTMTQILLVALGGGMGSMLRALLSMLALSRGVADNIAILAINISGSALIGVAFAFALDGVLPRLGFEFVAIGLLGGYTTVSTFAVQVLNLRQNDNQRRAGWIVLGSLLSCPAACMLAYVATRALMGGLA